MHMMRDKFSRCWLILLKFRNKLNERLENTLLKYTEFLVM